MIREFQEKIGYAFKDEALLSLALTHGSYAHEKKLPPLSDNERLEFLGDAVLEIVTSEMLFREHPDWPEGKLTRTRAALVCEPTLALCATEMGLGAFLTLGKGEDMSGGRMRKSVLSDALEAVIGAIYIDGGLEMARAFVMQFVLNDIEHKQMFVDSKSTLQEIFQARAKDVPEYELLSESGPPHARVYEAQVKFQGKVLAKGKGQTKKAAEQDAAYKALMGL